MPFCQISFLIPQEYVSSSLYLKEALSPKLITLFIPQLTVFRRSTLQSITSSPANGGQCLLCNKTFKWTLYRKILPFNLPLDEPFTLSPPFWDKYIFFSLGQLTLNTQESRILASGGRQRTVVSQDVLIFECLWNCILCNAGCTMFSSFEIDRQLLQRTITLRA